MPRSRPKDLRDEPAYLIGEVAHYLNVPASTVRAWSLGQRLPSGPMAPILPIAQANPPTLSFWNLVEVYVLATIRKRHRVSLQRVRKALKYVERHLGSKRPLIEREFLTDGLSLFVEEYSRLVEVSSEGQMALRQVLEASLQRIDRDPKGLATRLYPWLTKPEEPKHIIIDPFRSFGRPILIQSGISTAVLAERFRAGDSIAALVDDYRVTSEQVETAIRWESRVKAAA